MHISKITLHNFKGFKDDCTIKLDKGINFFVGDNNCGKSSIFEAIDFIRAKKSRDEVITKNATESDYVSVEIELTGDRLEALLETDSLKKYKDYLIDNSGVKTLRIKRSSKDENITQGNKPKALSIANVRVFNEKSNQFENPTGVDNTITALFDAQFVWADTNSGDIADFQKTKLCGKLITAITKDFVKSDTWKNFQQSHEATFGEGENSLAAVLKPIEIKLRDILVEQYGETEVRFTFTLPEIESFFKTGNISLSENGIETSSAEKGTGMQRALALSLIQVYADVSSSGDDSKPILFFIDEPETFLHPQAQNKLLNALEKLSTKSQVVIITHSPYLLKKYKKDTHSMNVFSKIKESGQNKVALGKEFDLFGNSSPSWGEINYYAFGVNSEEFHNELYGFIQAKLVETDDKFEKQKHFDLHLASNGFTQDKDWSRGSMRMKHTLATYIRNFIHHPENTENSKYSENELAESTQKLIVLLKAM